MQITPRAVVVAAFGVGPLLLAAGCGGTTSEGSTATLANIQPTSFVEVAPATTTTTTTTIFVDPGSLTPGTRSPVEQTYTIQAGDSLGRIANLYDITLEQLVNYNQFPDGAGQLILPGEQIKIPPGALVPGTGGGTETVDDSGSSGSGGDDGGDESLGGGCTHVIAAGEFPNKVARQYGITYEQLQAANPAMDMTTTFVVGDTLIIPPEGDCS